MENTIKNNRVLFDTNIVRRLLEKDQVVENAVHLMEKDGYEFYISDMSLFELVIIIHTDSELANLLTILADCKFRPIYKIQNPLFDNQFSKWFCPPFTELDEIKMQLLPSFSYTLSTVLADIANAIIVAFSNHLAIGYANEFYKAISAFVGYDKKYFEKIIEDIYINENVTQHNHLNIVYKTLVLAILSFYEILQDQDTFTEQIFQTEYQKQIKQYKEESFKDICAKILTDKDIQIDASGIDNQIETEYITSYIKNLLRQNMGFNVNDLTDYINFKYALEYCDKYYTQDANSLKKIKRCIPNNADVQRFIDETKEFRANYEKKINI